MQVTTKQGQNIFDIAIQDTGNVENAIAIANNSDIGITDALALESVLSIPDDIEVDIKVKNYYDRKQLKPATDTNRAVNQDGIEFWGIEIDFYVN